MVKVHRVYYGGANSTQEPPTFTRKVTGYPPIMMAGHTGNGWGVWGHVWTTLLQWIATQIKAFLHLRDVENRVLHVWEAFGYESTPTYGPFL